MKKGDNGDGGLAGGCIGLDVDDGGWGCGDVRVGVG